MSSSPFIIALAEAAGTAPEAAEQQLLDVDGTLLVVLALFLLLIFALTQWLWKPYLRVREERVTRVDGYREEAQRLELDATTRLNKVEAELAEARRLGSQEQARVRAEGQAHESRIVSEALASANKTLAEARIRVETSLAAERAKLQGNATTLGREIAERVLGRGVTS